VYSDYEVLDPDDFSHLGNQPPNLVLPPPPTSPGEEQDQEPSTKSVNINTSMLNILDEVLKKVKNTKVEVPEVVVEKEVEASESVQISKKRSSTDLGNQMVRRQVLQLQEAQEAQEKYGVMAKVEREDLDMEGLAEYFAQLKPLQTDNETKVNYLFYENKREILFCEILFILLGC
jgi:hypothetical protein